jgi:hypothetical protein
MTEEILKINGRDVVATRGGVPLKPSDFGLLESEQVALHLPVLGP